MKKIFSVIIAFLPIFLLAQEVDNRGYIVEVGQDCPDFELTLQDGTKTSLKELNGKLVMLQFTASWCGVCRREMPRLTKMVRLSI